MSEMDHMDLECISMLNAVLRDANRIKFNMGTVVAEAITTLNKLRKDHGLPFTMANDTYVRNNHHLYDVKRKPNDRMRIGWSIRSIQDEWMFFTTDSGSSALTLPEHLKQLNIGIDREPDMVRISVDLPRVETPKGFVLAPSAHTGWVYDPKGFFWPKE